jgi:hypothetical protein
MLGRRFVFGMTGKGVSTLERFTAYLLIWASMVASPSKSPRLALRRRGPSSTESTNICPMRS